MQGRRRVQNPRCVWRPIPCTTRCASYLHASTLTHFSKTRSQTIILSRNWWSMRISTSRKILTNHTIFQSYVRPTSAFILFDLISQHFLVIRKVVCISVYRAACKSISLYACLSLSVCLHVCLSFSLFCLSVPGCLSADLPVCLSHGWAI